jgi:hypothetical protein
MTVAATVLAYDPNKVKPGWIAFFVVMILVVATFLLWRSMNTQLGKIRVPPRASFGPNGAPNGADRTDPSGSDEEPPAAPDPPPPAGDDQER